jgi:dihydrodipicolinate synthase/N-acetylneuraminate lyase
VLQAEIPNLVGTKHVGSDFAEFVDLVRRAPELAHFASEHTFAPYTRFGARGIYSWFANFNARWLVEWYEAMAEGRWDEATARQRRMAEFIAASTILHGEGNDHAVIGKAVTAASSFLVPANRTRRPYLPVAQEVVAEFRRITLEQFPDMVWQGG